MAQLLLNPGFEIPTAWSYTGLAARSTDQKHSGLYSGKLWTRIGYEGDVYQSTITQPVLLAVGQVYELYTYIYPGTGTSRADRLYIEADPGNGSYVELGVYEWGDIPWGEWSLSLFNFPAKGTAGRIRYRSLYTGSASIHSDQWYIDDTVLDNETMAYTHVLKTLLLSDLGDISVANGFTTDVAEIREHYARAHELQLPAICIGPPGKGGASVETLTQRTTQATQVWGVKFFVKSDDVPQAVEDLLDDIRNALERSSGAVRSSVTPTKRVVRVLVDEWDEDDTSDYIEGSIGSFRADVSVTYQYRSGDL